jgi:hypothetical protein
MAGNRSCLTQRLDEDLEMASKLYYDPVKPHALATLQKLRDVAKNMTHADIKKWVEKQDAYTLHRLVRKRIHRNPYNVTNIDHFWDCNLVDVQDLNKHNDGVKYVLTVIDVFSKLLHIVPLSSKTGKAVTTTIQSFFKNPKYSQPIRRRPVWVRTDKG